LGSLAIAAVVVIATRATIEATAAAGASATGATATAATTGTTTIATGTAARTTTAAKATTATIATGTTIATATAARTATTTGTTTTTARTTAIATATTTTGAATIARTTRGSSGSCHAGRNDDDLTAAAGADGFGANFGFRAQRHVDDTAFTAAHGREKEGLAGLLDAIASGLGRKAQFFDAEQAIVEGVEDDQRMVFMRQAQHFHREVFEGQQQFSLVLEQEVGFGTTEANDNVRVFDFGIGGIAFHELVVDVDVDGIEKYVEKVPDLVFVLFDWVFTGHWFRTDYFFFFTLTTVCDGGVTGAGLTLL
jgi:hypothetical protein